MSTSPIQEAARLNTMGASLLAGNDLPRAVQAFREALSLMQSFINAHGVPDASNNAQDPVCASFQVKALNEPFYVFNEALTFEAAPDMDLSLANAFVLFNLALCFHVRGKTENGTDSKLRKACHLYNLCENLLAPEESATNGALLVAVANNRAQCERELMQYDMAFERLQTVLDLAYSLLPAMNNECSQTPFRGSFFDEVFLNATMAQPPATAPCA